MDDRIIHTTQFTIKQLAIVSKIGTIDVTGLFEELNIYDSIFNPCMTGNIVIRDAIGLSDKLSFDGSEALIVNMGKTSEDGLIEKSFRIYKQSDRKSVSMNEEQYILHFVSDEFILSQQIKIRQSFKDTYSKIVLDIASNYLSMSQASFGILENTIGNRILLVPNRTPFEAIDLCCRRAINYRGSPTFIFFENREGYNFVTLSTMLARPEKFFINFQPKNLSDDRYELMGARDYDIISQFDLNKNITSGLYAGTYLGFDVTNRAIVKKYVDFNSTYSLSEHANKTPHVGIIKNRAGFENTKMFDSRVVFYPTSVLSSKSDYVRENDPFSIDVEDDNYNYLIQREALYRNLVSRRIRVTMPGNFDLSSGLTANLLIPKRSEKSQDESTEDLSLSGKYLIIATRHIISYQKHETIIEVATDSNNRDSMYLNTQAQTAALEVYS
jgi:hypothetical protein